MSKGEKFIMIHFCKSTFPKQPTDNIYLDFTVFETLSYTVSFNSVLNASYFYRWKKVKWLVHDSRAGSLQIGIFNLYHLSPNLVLAPEHSGAALTSGTSFIFP